MRRSARRSRRGRPGPGAGGRIAALRVDGLELLVTEGWGPIAWGCYPMVPWAGRLRDGVLRWRGEEHRLPAGPAPAARHPRDAPRDGLGGRRGRARPTATLAADLGPPWPFGGRAVHRVGDARRLEPPRGARRPRRRPAYAGDRRLAPLVPPGPARRRGSRGRRAARRRPRRRRDAAARRRRAADGRRWSGRSRPRPWDDCFVGRWPDAAARPLAGRPRGADRERRPVLGRLHRARGRGLRRAPDRAAERPQHGEHAVVEPGSPLVGRR